MSSLPGLDGGAATRRLLDTQPETRVEATLHALKAGRTAAAAS